MCRHVEPLKHRRFGNRGMVEQREKIRLMLYISINGRGRDMRVSTRAQWTLQKVSENQDHRERTRVPLLHNGVPSNLCLSGSISGLSKTVLNISSQKFCPAFIILLLCILFCVVKENGTFIPKMPSI